MYNKFKDVTNTITKHGVGKKQPKQVNEMTQELQDACKIRKKTLLDILKNPSNDITNETYHQSNHMVKAARRKQKTWNKKKIIEI